MLRSLVERLDLSGAQNGIVLESPQSERGATTSRLRNGKRERESRCGADGVESRKTRGSMVREMRTEVYRRKNKKKNM